VVVLTNSRSSWVMFFLGMSLYGVYLLRSRVRLRWGRGLAAAAATVGILGALAWYSPATHRYVDLTMGLFSGNFQRIDKATAYRASIWEVGARVYEDHWFNGVGVRGFPEVYMDYAGADNFWRLKGVAPTHPHLQGLEIATDTGSVGLLGLLLFYLGFLRYAWPRSGGGRLAVTAWAIPLLVAVCPFNTHVSFYGAYWSGVIWWLACLALGLLAAGAPQREASSSA